MLTTRRRFLAGVSTGLGGLVVGCGTTQTADNPGGRGVGAASAGGSGGTTTGGGSGSTSATDSGLLLDSGGCIATNSDAQGPFYRLGTPVRSNLDLYGEQGDRLQLSGVVRDGSCQSLANAVVEIWAADSDGVYDSDSDEQRYYGQVATDGAGRYSFTTISPGRYLNGSTFRPAHIHMKVWLGATNLLITQIYFAGDPYLDVDPLAEPSRTIVLAQSAGLVQGVFDVNTNA